MFIKSLVDQKLDVSISRNLLMQITVNEFVEEDSTVRSLPQGDVVEMSQYNIQIAKLQREPKKYFSKERCLWILEKKENFQQKKMKDFTPVYRGNGQYNIKHTDKISKTSQNVGGENGAEEVFKQNIALLEMYMPDSDFFDAVQAQDRAKIKAHLMFYINNQHYSVQDALLSVLYVYQYAEDSLEEYTISKFRPAIKTDSSEWNDEYLIEAQGDLNNNFSMERLLNIINIVDHIGEKPQEHQLMKQHKIIKVADSSNQQGEASRKSSVKENQTACNQKYDDLNKKEQGFMKVVLVIGGVVVAAVLSLYALLKGDIK